MKSKNKGLKESKKSKTTIIKLSKKDSQILLKALKNPPEPCKALRKAFKKFK